MKRINKIISLYLISLSLLTLPAVSVQASNLPKLEITNRNYQSTFGAKQYKNRSIIVGITNGGSYIVPHRENFEYFLNSARALMYPRVAGSNTNNIYFKDTGYSNGPVYFHLNKTNPYGDVVDETNEINDNYVNRVKSLYDNVDVTTIYPLGDNVEWVQLKCTKNGKNENILINKNGTIVNATALGLTDDRDAYFTIKTIDAKGNLITSQLFDDNEYILKVSTDGTLDKFDLRTDLTISKNVNMNDKVISSIEDMMVDENENIVGYINERDKDYQNYIRDIGVFKIEGSKVTLIKKLDKNLENFYLNQNRFIKDNNNNLWVVTGGKDENYLNKFNSSYELEPKFALSREVSELDIYDDNNIIVSSSIGYGFIRRPVTSNMTDELYKTAYDSTMAAINNKNQESINKARKEIIPLLYVCYPYANEFSKQVDRVQQQLFENFINVLFDKNGMKKSYSNVTQEELNTARKLVNSFATCDDNKPYVASWSSGIDEFQQYKIQLANNSVEAYEKSKTDDAKNKATEAVNELLRVQDNNTVLNFAKALEKRLASK